MNIVTTTGAAVIGAYAVYHGGLRNVTAGHPLHLRLTALVATAVFDTLGIRGGTKTHPGCAVRYGSLVVWSFVAVTVLRRVVSARKSPAPRTGYEAPIYRYTDVLTLPPHMRFMNSYNGLVDFSRTVSIARVSGPLTLGVLRDGLRVLMARHGNLRCGVHRDGRGDLVLHEYDEPFDRLELNVITRVTSGTWRVEYDRLINTPRVFVAHDRLLWAVTFVEGTPSEILFTASHAIADGTSCPAFFSSLLACCALVAVPGADVAAIVSRERRAVDTVLVSQTVRSHAQYPSRWYRALPALARAVPFAVKSYIYFQLGNPKIAVHTIADRRECMFFHKMPRAATSALLATAKSKGVTLNSLVHGIYVRTYQTMNSCQPGFPFLAITAVRIGNYVTPLHPHTDIVQSASGVEFWHTLRAGATLWDYAEECHQFVHKNPNTKLPSCALTAISDTDANTLLCESALVNKVVLSDAKNAGRIANAILSNLGDISKFFPKEYPFGPNSEKLVMEEFYVNQSNRVMGPEGMLLLHCFHGEMMMSFNFPTPMVTKECGEAFVALFLKTIAEL